MDEERLVRRVRFALEEVKKKKKKQKSEADIKMRDLIKPLETSRYVKWVFDTPNKREFMAPVLAFFLPLMLMVVQDMGPEAGFEFMFSSEFKAIALNRLGQIRRKEVAVKEVQDLAKELGIKFKKTRRSGPQ